MQQITDTRTSIPIADGACFTAEQARPELPLIISIANALDANVEIKARSRRSAGKRRKRDTAAA
jgi:hypothetical protein